MQIPLTAAVEGDADEAVVRRIAREVNRDVHVVHVSRGKGSLDARLGGYNNAARFAPWVVVRDLNADARCAPELVRRLLPVPAQYMMFRITVRKIEAWLLSDRVTMSRFLGVSVSRIPDQPEALDDPKATLVSIAQHSRYSTVAEDIVPVPGMSVSVGRGYTARIIEFATRYWRPLVAADVSDSLARCMRAISRI